MRNAPHASIRHRPSPSTGDIYPAGERLHRSIIGHKRVCGRGWYRGGAEKNAGRPARRAHLMSTRRHVALCQESARMEDTLSLITNDEDCTGGGGIMDGRSTLRQQQLRSDNSTLAAALTAARTAAAGRRAHRVARAPRAADASPAAARSDRGELRWRRRALHRPHGRRQVARLHAPRCGAVARGCACRRTHASDGGALRALHRPRRAPGSHDGGFHAGGLTGC